MGITQEVFQSNCLSFINHAFIVHLLLSFALRSRPAFIIVKLCFAFSDDETSGPHVVAISLLSFLLGLTWLILALISIYKKRYQSVHQNNKPGGESIHLEEAPNMTQQYDGAHGMVVNQLEAENMNLDNVDEEGLVAEGNYTDVNGDNTEVKETYTTLGRCDQESHYESLKHE